MLIFLFLLLRSCTAKIDPKTADVFVVSKNMEAAAILQKLNAQDFAKRTWFLDLALLLHGGAGRIRAGGYRIAQNAGSWTIASILTSDPLLRWVTIPEGLRKEQVADRLQQTLGWRDVTHDGFLHATIATPYDLTEGLYYPDTYLIPTDETDMQVLKRFINRFHEAFDPLYPQLQKRNIRPNTAIKIASIIQREAAGNGDMPLIAGILWNRLLQKMPLQIDATLQYARGNAGKGYWAPITPSDKQIDSPFNTYAHAGLPPMPIANPGLDAIDAVLHPIETKCLYYLHDNDRQIHCSQTYAEHLANIQKYLREGSR